VEAAFASTPREQFLGPGPWRIFTRSGTIPTPSSDPAFLYQDVLVSLQAAGGINNGQPSLHAACISALNIQEGEIITHIGAGAGYYTAILAKLTGPTGRVHAFEIEALLAAQAKANLAGLPKVAVRHRSGSIAPIPESDVIYVNAGATEPLAIWLDALRPGGRLMFPMTPDRGAGAMLLVKRASSGEYEARFVMQVVFIPCAGARDARTAQKLSAAFEDTSFKKVRSLRRNTPPDETCWVAGADWWLSTAGLNRICLSRHIMRVS
jgi:protein-L-isoaspartate(D-aspartate) O-methyltransferase